MTMTWSDRLDDMAQELEIIEMATRADDIHVTTREDSTRVSLVYEHDVGSRPDASDSSDTADEHDNE